MKKFSFVHVGIAAGLAAAIATGAGLIGAVGASNSTPTTFVPITPCRLTDTRAGANQTGPRATPLNATETLSIAVWGSNGHCVIPSTAAGVVANVTIVNGTAKSFLTVFPSDAPQPTASNLNWLAGSPATPNQVTVGLSATGALSVFNSLGKADLIIDLVGYHLAAAPNPARVLWVATNGTHPAVIGGSVPVFASISEALDSITGSGSGNSFLIKVAPGVYDEPGGVDLKSFVDIEGSGPAITTITCTCGSISSPAANGNSATVRATGPFLRTALRNISVTNTGGTIYSTGIWASNILPGALALTDLKVSASGGSGQYGIWNTNSSPTMHDLTVSTVGDSATSTESFGIVNDAVSNPVMNAIDVTAEGALTTNGIRVTGGSSPLITGVTSTAKGINDASSIAYSVYVLASNFTMEGDRLVATRANASAQAWSAGFGSSSSVVTIKNTYLGAPSAVTSVAGTLITITGSTLLGQVTGPTSFHCAYNTDGAGNALANC